MQQPPSDQPKKPVNGWLVLFIVIGVLGTLGTIYHAIGGDASGNITTSTRPALPSIHQTPTPTPVPKSWQTTHTYTGNGDKQTETIQVAENWKIQWSCQADDAPLYVSIYNADTNEMAELNAISTTCKNTPTTGETFEHKGGNIYLNIISGIDWSITVQELK